MNICDGIGVPCILRTEEELCLNRFFDTDVVGWYEDNVTIDQYQEDTVWGSYVLEIEDSSAVNLGYAYYQATIDIGVNQNIVFGAWMRGITSDTWQGILEFRDNNILLGRKYFNYDNTWEHYSILLNNVDITNGNLVIRIYPENEAVHEAKIRLINAKMRVVNNIIELDQPTNKSPIFNKELQFQAMKDYFNRNDYNLKGYRFKDYLNYEHIERDLYRSILLAEEDRRLLYYPHLDADTFYMARIGTNQSQRYLASKYLGHSINLEHKYLAYWEQPLPTLF